MEQDKTDMEQGGEVAEPPQSKMHALNNQIDIVIDKMKDNMEQIIKRGENMSDLLDTSEEMEREARGMMRTSRQVARSYWWKNVKLIVVIVVVALIIVLIIVLLATGVIPVGAPLHPIVTPTSKP